MTLSMYSFYSLYFICILLMYTYYVFLNFAEMANKVPSIYLSIFLPESPLDSVDRGASGNRRCSGGDLVAGVEGTRQVCTCCTAGLTMAAASVSERRGGSFFSVRLRCAPHGTLRVSIRSGARDSNLAKLYAWLMAPYMCARYTPYPDWAYPGRNRGKEGRRNKGSTTM